MPLLILGGKEVFKEEIKVMYLSWTCWKGCGFKERCKSILFWVKDIWWW
jgi:hypothetical protein